MRVALIGGVESTLAALHSLIGHGVPPVGVMAYQPEHAHTSGWVDVAHAAERAEIENTYRFTKVNDPTTVSTLASWRPDYLLVVGLSQIVKKDVRETAKRLAVGFHPTALPQGRGRAPIAWLVLNGGPGAATLFELQDEADAGHIIAQVPFPVGPRDHASDVLTSCLRALDEAIGKFVAAAKFGDVPKTPQDVRRATYWGVRKPEDGRINWAAPCDTVDALVRAAASPHPGAYTVSPQGNTVVFMRSHGYTYRHSGVPGRLLSKSDDRWLIACGTGAVDLGEIKIDNPSWKPRVGDLLTVGLHQADLMTAQVGHMGRRDQNAARP